MIDMYSQSPCRLLLSPSLFVETSVELCFLTSWRAIDEELEFLVSWRHMLGSTFHCGLGFPRWKPLLTFSYPLLHNKKALLTLYIKLWEKSNLLRGSCTQKTLKRKWSWHIPRLVWLWPILDPTGGSSRAPTVESHAREALQGGCVPSAMWSCERLPCFHWKQKNKVMDLLHRLLPRTQNFINR